MTTAIKSKADGGSTPPIILMNLVWHALIAVALVVLSYRIFTADVFAVLGSEVNLGQPVQVFAATIVLLPAIFGMVASVLMLIGNPQGRYWSLMMDFSCFAFGLFALVGVWGFYESFELLVDGIMANARIALGFPIAYGVYWLAGRLPQSRFRELLETASLGLAMLTLIVMLLLSGILDGAWYVITRYAMWQAWAVTIFVAIAGFMTWRILYMGDYFGETPAQREAWQGWFMLAPNILGFVLFFAGPLLLSFYLSFTNSSVGRTPEVVWFDNYAEILSLQVKTTSDQDIFAQETLDFGYAVLGETNFGSTRIIFGAKDVRFWISMRNTMLFTVMLLPLAVVPALGMSLILNSKLPGVTFFRAIYFLPSVAAVVGTALIWRWLYDPVIGFINYTIGNIAVFFGLADPNINWLTDPNFVLLSIVILAAWQVVGYNTVLFLAGLQGIPNVLYEAAQIDGANRWQQFRNVTLPLLAPTTFFVMITTMVTGLQVFNEPYALFSQRPAPDNAITSVYYLYLKGFPEGLFGYSSAVAWILFAIIFSLTLVQFRVNNNQAYE